MVHVNNQLSKLQFASSKPSEPDNVMDSLARRTGAVIIVLAHKGTDFTLYVNNMRTCTCNYTKTVQFGSSCNTAARVPDSNRHPHRAKRGERQVASLFFLLCVSVLWSIHRSLSARSSLATAIVFLWLVVIIILPRSLCKYYMNTYSCICHFILLQSNEEVSTVLIPGLRQQSESSGRRRQALSSPASPSLSSSSQDSRKHSMCVHWVTYTFNIWT